MNAAFILATLFAIPSVHSAPSRSVWDWARASNFKPALNPAVTAASPSGQNGICVQHTMDTTTLVNSMLAKPSSYYFASSSMTRSWCQSHCNFKFRQENTRGWYAVFDGRRCYCLETTYRELEILELGQCTSPCTGNSQETCGGPTSSFISYA
jgi:hypothetical protein